MSKNENIPKREFVYCPVCAQELQINFVDGRNRKNCQLCGFIDYKNPLPCVSIIGIKGDKIALIKRGIEPSKGLWTPPSGFMEAGEKPEETALRELYEETSLKGEILDLLGVYSQNTKIYGNLVIIIFLVRITGGDIKAGDDAMDAKFFEAEEIPKMKHDFYNNTIEKVKKLIKEHK
jgi:ADP-ribose pyrophosphatase YjhB (NUDIX family)